MKKLLPLFGKFNMKKLVLALILSPLPPINAMQRFIAKNNTQNPVTLGGQIIAPNEEKEFKLPCWNPITIESSNETGPLVTILDADTRLIEINYTNNSTSDSNTLTIQNPHKIGIIKRATRPLIILNERLSPLVIEEENPVLLMPKVIESWGLSSASADLSANTKQVSIFSAETDRPYHANIPQSQQKLVRRKNTEALLVVTLANNATGLRIFGEMFDTPKVAQLQHVEIKEKQD